MESECASGDGAATREHLPGHGEASLTAKCGPHRKGETRVGGGTDEGSSSQPRASHALRPTPRGSKPGYSPPARFHKAAYFRRHFRVPRV